MTRCSTVLEIVRYSDAALCTADEGEGVWRDAQSQVLVGLMLKESS